MNTDGEKVIELLAELVAIGSVSGTPGERAVLTCLEGWLRVSGVSAHVDEEGEWPYLIASSRPGATGGLLILGHADTVPFGDLRFWHVDPCSAEIENDRLFGRGASDMKSGLAAATCALMQARDEGVAASLIVTCGEETGCVGAPSTLATVRELSPAAILIPESTAGLAAFGHRGAVWLTVEVRGVAAHGSTPESGDNAILKMARLLTRLPDIPLLSHPVLGSETISVGTISGGQSTNVVADLCRVTLDVRVVGMDAEHVVAWLRDQPEVASVEIALNLPAVWSSAGRLWSESWANPCKGQIVTYFTDAAVIQHALDSPVPIVICGPGNPATVHSPDESVGVRAVTNAVDQMVCAARSLR